MEYIVVRSFNVEEFEILVNKYLKQGFELKGGVAVDKHGKFYQAMTKPLVKNTTDLLDLRNYTV